VAVAIDRPLARYVSREVRRESLPLQGEILRAARRASVEIFLGVSGNPQYALIGGALVPSTVDELEVQLNISEDRPTGAPTTCPGTFGRDLVPGLADQFVKGIPRALMAQIARPGVIMIDRAAYDQVGSSVHAFSLAADLLGLVLSHESLPEAEGAIRQRLTEW
jgi:hypothetical protein